MDKQTTIAFILIGAILVLWLYISAPDPKQQPKQNNETTQTIKGQILEKFIYQNLKIGTLQIKTGTPTLIIMYN